MKLKFVLLCKALDDLKIRQNLCLQEKKNRTNSLVYTPFSPSKCKNWKVEIFFIMPTATNHDSC